jgi:hypothetical protein
MRERGAYSRHLNALYLKCERRGIGEIGPERGVSDERRRRRKKAISWNVNVL